MKRYVPDSYAILAYLQGEAGADEREISFADCFALALARACGGEVVTGDPEFAKAEGVAPVRWLPGRPGN